MKSGKFKGVAFFIGMASMPGMAWSAYDMQLYYPLTQGDSRAYYEVSRESGKTPSTNIKQERIGQTETIQGAQTVRQEYLNGDGSVNEYDSFGWTAEGLRIYQMTNREENGTLTLKPCASPLMAYPISMEVGQRHESTANCGNDGAVTVQHTLLGVENVSVEAGSFSNCLKMKFDIAGQGWSSNETQWLCPGVGVVKKTWTDIEGGATRENSQELRWATIGGKRYGAEETIGTIRTATAGARFWNDSRIEIYNLVVDGRYLSGNFLLDPDRVFFTYDPSGTQGNGRKFPGVGFQNAYIKMNGGRLTIYNVELGGAKYATEWEFVNGKEIGFMYKNASIMQ